MQVWKGYNNVFSSQANNNLEDDLECLDDEDFEEVKYDALNDETFGSESLTEGDWEQDHEKYAEITESTRPRLNSTDKVKKH